MNTTLEISEVLEMAIEKHDLIMEARLKLKEELLEPYRVVIKYYYTPWRATQYNNISMKRAEIAFRNDFNSPNWEYLHEIQLLSCKKIIKICEYLTEKGNQYIEMGDELYNILP